MKCNRRQALGVMGAFPLVMKLSQPKAIGAPSLQPETPLVTQDPEVVSTGFSSLDKALNGGFRRGELVAVMGVPGSGKAKFCERIVEHMRRSGETAVINDWEPATFEEQASHARRTALHCYRTNQIVMMVSQTKGRHDRKPLFDCPLTLSYMSSVILRLVSWKRTIIMLDVVKSRYGNPTTMLLRY